jgi:hypothetical protein
VSAGAWLVAAPATPDALTSLHPVGHKVAASAPTATVAKPLDNTRCVACICAWAISSGVGGLSSGGSSPTGLWRKAFLCSSFPLPGNAQDWSQACLRSFMGPGLDR